MSADCAYAEELYDIIPLQAVQWIYIILSVAAVVLVLHTARHYLDLTIFENITKELIIFLYAYIALYSIFVVITQLSQLIYRYAAREKCDAQVPKVFCIFRYILTPIVTSFLVLHVGITAQHALSTFRFCYLTQKLVVRITLVCSFVYPVILGVSAYWNESLQGRTPYCTGITAKSAAVFNVNLYILLVLDVLNTMASIVLWQYTRQRLATEHTFILNLSFHRRQNLYAMQQFLPIAATHAIVYIIFIVSNYICRNFLQSVLSPGRYTFYLAIVNVIPFYCCLCPLTFLVLIRKGRFERVSHVHNLIRKEQNPNQVYFSALRDQWK